jgi:hypothetical protein
VELHRRGARLIAAAALVVAAGCSGGGSGHGGGGGQSSAQSGGGAQATPTTGARGDQAIAQDANLRLSDFPAEFQSTPVPADAAAASEQDDIAFADCMGRPRPDQIRTATANSPDFSAQDTRRASSTVQLVKTEAIASDDYAALRGDRALTCVKQQIDGEFARQLGASAPTTTIERTTLPQFGDDTIAFRMVGTGQVQGQTVVTYLDLTFVRKGRAEISGGFINRATPFPADLERTLLQRMVGRA